MNVQCHLLAVSVLAQFALLRYGISNIHLRLEMWHTTIPGGALNFRKQDQNSLANFKEEKSSHTTFLQHS